MQLDSAGLCKMLSYSVPPFLVISAPSILLRPEYLAYIFWSRILKVRRSPSILIQSKSKGRVVFILPIIRKRNLSIFMEYRLAGIEIFLRSRGVKIGMA